MNPLVRQAYLRELQDLQKEAAARAILSAATGLVRAGASRGATALGKAVQWPMQAANRAAGTEKHLAQLGYKPSAGGGWERAAQGLGQELQGAKAWWDPRGAAHRVGLGFKATGNMLTNPVKTLREGWNSSGVFRAGADGKMIEEGAGIGMKGMTAAFTAPSIISAGKKHDPLDPDAGRGERLGKAIGEGVGFVGGQTGGMIAAMTAGKLLGEVGGFVGKGVDATARGISSLAGARRVETQSRPSDTTAATSVQQKNTQREGLSG